MSNHRTLPRLIATALGCAALSLVPVQPAAAQSASRGSTLVLDLTTGFLSGGASEYVYDQNVDGSTYKASQLDWASRPLVYWGVGARFSLPWGCYASFSLKAGIGGKTGYMTDTDWLNYDGEETMFSESDSYTDQALILDVEVGYDFRLGDSLWIGPFVKLGYLNFEWTARDGYLQYAAEYYPTTDSEGNSVYGAYTPISANTPVTYVSGIGIVYQQSCLYPAIGLRVVYDPARWLRVTASFDVAPSLRMTETDNHVERGLIFTSTLSGGLALEPRLVLSCRLSKTVALGLDVSYLKIENLTGDLKETDTYGDSYTYSDSAGASFEAVECALTLSIRM